MKPPSKRFSASKWSERLVPLLLVILIIGLLVTLAVVVLSILGLTPAMAVAVVWQLVTDNW